MLLADLHFAIRQFRRHPAVYLVVVLAFALGIGTNTAVFTLVNAVLFRGLPFEDGERIVHLENDNPARGWNSVRVSYPDFEDWRSTSQGFEGLAAYNPLSVNLSDDSNLPERFAGALVSPEFFSLIGQRPVLGRDFASGEDSLGAPQVVLLSYSLWQDRFGGAPDILGSTVRVNGVPHEVIGVMPEGMLFPFQTNIWLPLRREADLLERGARRLDVIGKLKQGVSLKQVRSEMDAIALRLQEEYPDSNAQLGIVVKPYNEEVNGGEIRIVFLALLASVGFVLLIVCANITNLLLVRTMSRRREISLRAALGASRWRVVRQLLSETLLLSLIGGLGGLALAWFGVRLFDAAVANVDKPYWIKFDLDISVFGYFFALCIVAGALAGLAPSLQAFRIELIESLKEAGRWGGPGRRSNRLAAALVIAQLAISLVLLVGAGLMIRSLLNIAFVDIGVPNQDLLMMRLSLDESRYPDGESQTRFSEQLRKRLSSLPGVRSLTLASHPPMGGASLRGLVLEGQTVDDPSRLPQVAQVTVSPEYFRTVQVGVLRGRELEERDGSGGREVVLINQAFERRYLPDRQVLGTRIRLGREPDTPWLTIVGVTPTIRQNSPNQIEPIPVVYVPYRFDPSRFMEVIVRAEGDPVDLAPVLRSEIQHLDPDLPAYDVTTLAQEVKKHSWAFRVFGSAFSILAAIALFLSSIGLYTVVSYSVTGRIREIGVKMALGASTLRILAQFLRQGLGQLLAGLALGLLGAFALSRLIAPLLIRVSPSDPVTFGVVAVILSLVALIASYLPARRASRIDPMVVLRVE